MRKLRIQPGIITIPLMLFVFLSYWSLGLFGMQIETIDQFIYWVFENSSGDEGGSGGQIFFIYFFLGLPLYGLIVKFIIPYISQGNTKIILFTLFFIDIFLTLNILVITINRNYLSLFASL